MKTELILALSICMTALLNAQDYRAITRQSYDNSAAEYQESTTKLQPQEQAHAFLSRLSPNSKVLDLGCGPGRDAKYFTDHGHQVIGVDISPKMVALARDAAPQADFIVSDIESLSLQDNSLDAIWASASLLHVSKDQMPTVLAKLSRSLKPGGIFYLSMKLGDGEELTPDSRYGDVEKFWNYVTESELKTLLQAHGFIILEQTTTQKSTTYQTHPWISLITTKSPH